MFSVKNIQESFGMGDVKKAISKEMKKGIDKATKPLMKQIKKLEKASKKSIKETKKLGGGFKKLGKNAKNFGKNIKKVFARIGKGIALFFIFLFNVIGCVDNLLYEFIADKYAAYWDDLANTEKALVAIFTLPITIPLGFLYILYSAYSYFEMFLFPKRAKKRLRDSKKCKKKTIKENWKKVEKTFPSFNDFIKAFNPASIFDGVF
tara:strand:- start:6433 stop:7050 length:618 start_codon:yes stop_codon:yes gene_type:complete